MRYSESVICFRGRFLPLFLALAFLPGCPKDPSLISLPPPIEKHLAERGDPMLRNALIHNSPMPFAVIARFDAPVFPYQSELLADAGIPPVETTGNTALLVATAKEITGLFDAPSLLAIRYLGSQSSLARLHPEFEMELLRKFDSRKESAPITLLIRFRTPPESREERAVESAGFKIGRRSGPNWTLSGPADQVPLLMAIDEIIYLESASNAGAM